MPLVSALKVQHLEFFTVPGKLGGRSPIGDGRGGRGHCRLKRLKRQTYELYLGITKIKIVCGGQLD